MTIDVFTLAETIARKEQELDELRRDLAQLQASSRVPQGECVVLRCRLDGHAVALLATEIDEVVRMAELTVLPDSPAWLVGLLNVGSRSIPIVDLLGRETGVRRTPDPAEFIVLAEARSGACGLVVEAIEGLVAIHGAEIRRPEPEVRFGAHVLGVVQVANEALLVLSPAPLSLDDYASEGRA